MNFTAYINRQKSIIRSRHEGEVVLIHKGEAVKISDGQEMSETDKLFYELESQRGLNKRERMVFSKAI